MSHERRDDADSAGSWHTTVVYLLALLLPATYGLIYYFCVASEPIGPAAYLNETVAVMPFDDPISPLPTAIVVDRRKADLGRDLFFDPQLSGAGDVSCASCHDLTDGGDDGHRTSTGAGGRKGRINAPSVFNADFNVAQLWDGRSPTLESQVDGPINNPAVMASSWPMVIERLSGKIEYRQRFEAIYDDGVTAGNVRDAIATYERTLITPNARFDRYLRGEEGALDDVETRGYRLFNSMGCVSCHQGRNIGGNFYQKLGIIRPFYKDDDYDREDLGRFNVTGVEADRHVFRVPSLRNVALTAPYFHDGSVDTLEDAVKLMGNHQLGRVFKRHEIHAIVAFLKTLTGDMPS